MTTTEAPAKPILRDPPVITPSWLKQQNSARLVRDLRQYADGFLTIKQARALMKAAADEIERLQQLPLL